jgi:hypothetical protein
MQGECPLSFAAQKYGILVDTGSVAIVSYGNNWSFYVAKMIEFFYVLRT